MLANSAHKDPTPHLSKAPFPCLSAQSSSILPSHSEDRENFPLGTHPNKTPSKAVEKVVATYQAAVLTNNQQIEALSSAIAKEQDKLDKAALDAANKAALEEEVGQKTIEAELLKDKIANLNTENSQLSLEIDELSTKSAALREGRETIRREKGDLEACLAHLRTAQIVAEARLHELQTLNRHYEENYDFSFPNLAKMRACVNSEEELCSQLLEQLSRKEAKETHLRQELQQVEAELQAIEQDSGEEYDTRVESDCEDIWKSLQKTDKQLEAARANLASREILAQKQSSEAESLSAQLAQYPEKSMLSWALPQVLFALLLGLVLSLLLPRAPPSLGVA